MKKKHFAQIPPRKRNRVEMFAMKSACGNGAIANKGIRQPKPDRFTRRSVLDPNANRSLSEILGIPNGHPSK